MFSKKRISSATRAEMVENDAICEILCTSGPQRNKEMVNRLHQFFKKQKNTSVFVNKIFETKGEYQIFKIYQSLFFKLYDHNVIVNKVGDWADSLYFIVKGEIGVLTPQEHSQVFTNYYELLEFMKKEEKFVVNLYDSHSNIV